MPSPSGIRKDSSIFAFGDGGGMPPTYNDVSHINNHLHIYNMGCKIEVFTLTILL